MTARIVFFFIISLFSILPALVANKILLRMSTRERCPRRSGRATVAAEEEIYRCVCVCCVHMRMRRRMKTV